MNGNGYQMFNLHISNCIIPKIHITYGSIYDFDLCKTNIVTVFLKKNHILQNKTHKTFYVTYELSSHMFY